MAPQLNSSRLRIYSSGDLVGVELGGAVKNVIAIAAGICDGLSLGRNARAALITRGLAEIVRLGVAMGGQPETFMGLTGLGDLVLTCTGDLSRNREVGVRLAKGQALDDVLRELGHVAEGVQSAASVRDLAREKAVEMPITSAVCGVLFEGRSAARCRSPAPRAGSEARVACGSAHSPPRFTAGIVTRAASRTTTSTRVSCWSPASQGSGRVSLSTRRTRVPGATKGNSKRPWASVRTA